MSKTLDREKHRATSNLKPQEIVCQLIAAGFHIVNDPAATPKPTARKGAAYIRRHFGATAAYSRTGESIILRGAHIETNQPCEFFVRIATATGQGVGHLREPEITAITTATGLNFRT